MTEEEKQKIRENLLFKAKIKKEIESLKPPKSKNAKTLEFLNSPFGLFILSSILIGSLSWFYKYKSDQIEKEGKMENQRDKIKIELVQRFEKLSLISDSIRTESDTSLTSSFSVEADYSSLNDLEAAAYQEFNKRSIYSLFYELCQNTEDEKNKEATKKMMKTSKKISPLLNRLKRSISDTNRYIKITKNDKQLLQDTIIADFIAWKEIIAPE